MKNHLKWVLTIISIPVALLALFSFDNYPAAYEPILMTRSEMEKSVQVRDVQEIEKPGKIWVYNQYIFVIEQFKGIHIINNADPTNPVNIGFIQVDGCTDVAVKDGLIYANNAVDLIGIKPNLYSKTIEVVSRNRDVLPELLSPDGSYPYRFQKNRPENTIIVRYETYND